MPKYEVVVRYRNGRFLKAIPAKSKYQAKQIAKKQDEKYDPSWVIEIQEKL